MDVRGVLCILLQVYVFVLLARILSSWFPAPRSEAGRTVVGILHTLTEPVLRPLRNLIPPVRMGMAALDLSPIIVFIALSLIRRGICTAGIF